MNSGIYAIRNTVTGKAYVGSSAHLKTRLACHRRQLNDHSHCNKKLQHSWNAHGMFAFEFFILEYCDERLLANREQYWMDRLDSVMNGYNVYPFARTSLGHRLSAETRSKIAEKRRGKKLTDEQRQELSRLRAGKPQNLIGVAKRAALLRGRKHSEATRARLRELALARPVNMDAMRKTHEKSRGRKRTAEQIAKSAKAHIGAKRSLSARLNMAAAQRRRFSNSPPTRNALSQFVKCSTPGP